MNENQSNENSGVHKKKIDPRFKRSSNFAYILSTFIFF